MHEIITLQLGQQANYTGTHYWNTQESYFTYTVDEESPIDHDVSFRPGIGADGADTYTPRTIIYDLKGAFGTLRRENALYEFQHQHNPAQQGPWAGSTVSLQLPPIAPSPYQQALDQGAEPPPMTSDTVRFWSDYNRVFYHPRSIVQLNEYELNSSLMPFEQWRTGDELFTILDREHDLLDRDLRPFLEECDQLQGIQVLSTIDDAWGGFAARYLERITDELGKGSRWIFGLQNAPTGARERRALRLETTARSLHALSGCASMHVPLPTAPTSPPSYLSQSDSNPWETSALQSAAIESILLPARLRSTESARATFDTLEATLSANGNRRIAACALSVDDPERLVEATGANGHGPNALSNGFDDDAAEDTKHSDHVLDIDLFPEFPGARPRRARRATMFSSVEVLRGAWKAETEVRNTNDRARDRVGGGPRTALHQTTLLLPILSSYPQIFRFARHPRKLAVDARLSTSTAISHCLRGIDGITRRLVGVSEREELCDGLAAIADEYEEGWMSDNESDDE